MPTLKGTEASLSCEQCFLYLVSSSVNVSILHSTWLDTFWTDLVVSNSGCGGKEKLIKKKSKIFYVLMDHSTVEIVIRRVLEEVR